MEPDGSHDRSLDAADVMTPSRRVERTDVRLPVTIAIALLLLLVFPLAQQVVAEPLTTERLLAGGGVVLFVAVYLWAVPADLAGWAVGRVLPAVAVLSTLAVVISLVDRAVDWTVLFVAAATAAGRVVPSRRSVAVTAAIATTTAVALLVTSRSPGDAIESALEVGLVGLVVLAFSQLERALHELERSRAEVARLAADTERARIARDLHDLLGHSLSVIALKTELARRLVDRDPGRAGTELAEVEAVVRTALGDVRQAVAGYRRIALDAELSGARIALGAAAIEADVRGSPASLDESIDTTLGWVVREGVTNVIRHSAARRCSIRIDTRADEVRVEIIDDGRGPDGAASGTRPGTGLRGIRERLGALGGHLEAGPAEGGGFRLLATVPRSSPVASAVLEDGSR